MFNSRWNFTIREILFGMVAIGAILALINQSWTSSPTGIPGQIEADELVRRAAKNLNLQFNSVGSSAGGGGGGGRYQYDSELTILSPSEPQADAVMTELKAIVTKMLDDAGCTITGEGMSGTDKSIYSFSFHYRRKRTEGTLYVHSERESGRTRGMKDANGNPAKTWKVWTFAYERGN